MTDKSIFNNWTSTYANIFSYMNLPLTRELEEGIDAVIMGIPYDLATTGRSGTRFGPTGIRQAASFLRWEEARWPWQFTLQDRLKIVDYGDISFEDGNSDDMLELVTKTARQIMVAGKTLVSLGGDHFVTLPLLRAAHQVHGALAMVHFDAHADSDDDGKYNHGSMFFHAPLEGLIDPDSTVQIGIRTQYPYKDHKFKVIHGPEANARSAEDIAAEIRQVVGDKKTYLTFDIDCLDPAYAPGTGTPVSGGISSDKAMQIIRLLGDLNIVAADLVEVAPAYDHGDITSLVGATLVLEMLYLLASGKDTA